jgi:hypothetical protein
MWALGAALIAAGAAIVSSALTSWLTHCFERRSRRMEYELKWLEERFTPALNFLGRLSAIVSGVPNTEEERKQMANRIDSLVAGQSKESNAWTIALLLDPEETGLGDLILSAMTYARITESREEFTNYQVRLHLGLKELAEEFRRERQAIASGKSLESLIKGRKSELRERTRRTAQALNALRAFSEGKEDLTSTLREVKESGVRGAGLNWVFDIASNAGASDQQKQAKLAEVRQVCEERDWFAY